METITKDSVVYVVDDDSQIRESLSQLFESAGLRFKVHSSAEDFLDDCSLLGQSPECLVLALCLRGISGLNLMEQLTEQGIDISVIVITDFADVPTAVQAMKLGAIDVIAKPFSRIRLLEKIQATLSQQAKIIQDKQKYADECARLESLTERERGVMELIFTGKNAKQIGSFLDIGTKTVAKHRAKVFEKLQVDNTVELIHLAYNCELVQQLLKQKRHAD